MRPQPLIHAFFDEPTNTVSYIVADPVTKQAAVIDQCWITIRIPARPISVQSRRS